MQHDFLAIREQVLPFPTPSDGYTRVLLLGTTGAGKTTLVRQLIGTDPETEHFPSTSTAKTTTCDLELILAQGRFEAVVSFLPRNIIRTYVEESVTAAVLAHIEGRKPQYIERKLLEHSEQRFRLSYLLGKLSSSDNKTSVILKNSDASKRETSKEVVDPVSSQERLQRIETLQRYMDEVYSIGNTIQKDIEKQADLPDDTVGKEEHNSFIEDFLDNKLRTYQAFQNLVADIMHTIEGRFDLLLKGRLAYDEDGWPLYWIYMSEERRDFLVTVNQFSSNSATQFGRLLTPLVQGIRVKGPFHPSWQEGIYPRLVLIDGEGLGHTFDTATSLSTNTTARFEHMDAIVLVDNAQQPMQAAPYAVLKAVVTGGHVAKLFVCFTHFEIVDGDNFSDEQDRSDHVQNSLDNTIAAISKELGTYNSAALRNRLENNIFFLSHLQQETLPEQICEHLNELLYKFEAIQQATAETTIQPVYEKEKLFLSLRQAVYSFREAWQGRLGLTSQSTRHPEHWATIKAFARRPAELGLDEYKTLRPVADLIREISEHVKQLLDQPLTWEFANYRSEEERQIAIDTIAREVYAYLHTLSRQCIILDSISDWQIAYSRSGKGSTKVRAYDIEQIYRTAAPMVEELEDDEIDALFLQVTDVVRNAILAEGGKLL